MSVTGCKLPYCARSRCTPNALLVTGQTGAPKRYGHKQACIPWVPRRSLFLHPCRALRPAYASAGSTGVSLAMVAAAEGVRCHIAMPDDAALEKSQLLAALGANVQRVRPVSISHPEHFVNVARKVKPHLPERSHRIYHEEERGLSEDIQQ